ncbi:TPA: hypothetical protein DDZ86_05050 [Candidatus Dependentiae bacterium]|nr:hypothetical protein [Candidatus Dependentiae bacterium]
MDKVTYKYKQLTAALRTLGKALAVFKDLETRGRPFNPQVDYVDEYRIYRDSIIQRFEYTIDLFWKYLKTYLETAQVPLTLKTPSEIIRSSFSSGIISEDEAQQILEMLKSRNTTLHVYVEEVAEQLAHIIPGCYALLGKIIQRLKK